MSNPQINKGELIDELAVKFPFARVGFIQTLVDALELHEKKNHDYNGTSKTQNYNDFETKSKFFDIRRKYERLYHIIAEGNEVMVDEKLEDTVIDLGNYSFLLAEYLLNLKEKQNESKSTEKKHSF